MKNSLLFAAALIVASCGSVPDLEWGNPRRSHYVQVPVRGDSTGQDNDSVSSRTKETALFFSVVQFPVKYDWRRDSACGMSSAKILLYKNFEQVDCFDAGDFECIGTDPDTHHWLQGDLYTEYDTYDGTVIKKNGKELFRYEGREFLKGLLCIEDDVWTLGQNCNGDGFSLRRNGEEVLKRVSGDVFGDLGPSSHQALYIDSGKLCFCYKQTTSSADRLYKVIDGEETLYAARSRPVFDMKILNGKVTLVYGNTNGIMFYEKGNYVCRMGEENCYPGCAWLCGAPDSSKVCISMMGSGEQEYAVWWGDSLQSLGVASQIYFYSEEDGNLKYAKFCGRSLVLYEYYGKEIITFPRPAVFSRQCLQFVDDDYYFAENPVEKGDIPLIVHNGEETPVNVNGYISGLEAVETEKEE